MANSSSIGKTLYGVLFVFVLPVFLVVWARMTETRVRLPVPGSLGAGLAVMSAGAVVMFLGMATLVAYGKGLPMNAFPPTKYVRRGIYRVVSHPIYVGFSILCIGFAVATSSASGLWLVSPVVMLGCVALVQGFEKHDLRKRFGDSIAKPFLHLPENEETPPRLADRLSVYFLVLLPWAILYEAVRVIGIPRDAAVAFLPFEMRLPVLEWTEIFYASTYLFVLLAPFVAKTKRDLREFSIFGLTGTGIVILLFLTIPLIAPPRPFVPHGLLGRLLAWERILDTPAAAFPSFHVVWAFLAARVYAASARSWKAVWWLWAALISISCVTTGMHAIVDVVGGFATFLIVARIQNVGELLRRLTERIANSWREWRFGPLRIISHGWYAALTAFVGLSIVGELLGPQYVLPMLIVALLAIIASALWAQFVEGSPSLLRPYGWYGGLIGAVAGIAIAKFIGASVWLLLGAFSFAAPVIQGIGRLRCLVQGCCHGREAPASVGIRYTHPMSRVTRLTLLGSVPVHATPFYSIMSNVAIAIIVARLWTLHAALSMIVGVYLILSSLARFVEESYRGEPQTRVIAGLRLYQWIAIATALVGVLVTMIANTLAAPSLRLNWQSLIMAGCFGGFAWFALGVDFPDSNRRFARLA